MIQLTQEQRQDLADSREMARRRPVTHEQVAQNLERVSLINKRTDIKQIQKDSPAIKSMYTYVQRNKFPDFRTVNEDELRGFLKSKRKFEIQNKTLMRKVGENLAIVLPSKMIGQLYRQFHEDGGHMSPERVYQNITQKYYAYGLLASLHLFTSKCQTCAQYDKRGVGNSPASFIQADSVGHKVFLDAIGKLAQESEEQFSYCLLAIDCHSRYAVGTPVRNLDGESVVKAIQKMYIFKFGYFQCLITDNGLDSIQLREFSPGLSCQVMKSSLTRILTLAPGLTSTCNPNVFLSSGDIKIL